MIAYILDNNTLNIKDILEFEKYSFKEDINYIEKSNIIVSRKPNILNDDLVYCKKGNEIIFIGLCATHKANSDTSEYEIEILQKENLFNRQIFLEEENTIQEKGIEDFIAKCIENNFTNSGDLFLDKNNVFVSAKTHTKSFLKVENENGVFNLKTFLGNIKQYHDIFLDFEIRDKKIYITVYKNEEKETQIDIETSDVSEYKENIEISVLSKLLVRWKIPDTQEKIGAVSKRFFYLLNDRSITEDESHKNRIKGIVKSVYIEAEKEEEMKQQVFNEFSSNRYNHKISFHLNRNSKLYPCEKFFVGRKLKIKTKSGVRDSIITKKEVNSESALILLTLGNLKVTLIDKLKGVIN